MKAQGKNRLKVHGKNRINLNVAVLERISISWFSVLEFPIVCSVIPGRREAASAESMTNDRGL